MADEADKVAAKAAAKVEAKAAEVVAVSEDDAARAEGLIAVVKGDLRLWVHKSCVRAHEVVGWVRAKV